MTSVSLRLGIDLDGVVADFNRGWISAYNAAFGAALHSEQVVAWQSPLELTHFPDMGSFWRWARRADDGSSIFRNLEPFPGAIESLHDLAARGHRLVIITAKPEWAVVDTLRWLADHAAPTREIHVTEDKHEVECDVYLDDSPEQVERLTRARATTARVCRFVRPWNAPVEGAHDVYDWPGFLALVEAEAQQQVA